MQSYLPELKKLKDPSVILEFADFADKTENYSAGRQAILHLQTVDESQLAGLLEGQNSLRLRNMLSVAYKHLTGALRTSRRSCEEYKKGDDDKKVALAKLYEQHLTSQLTKLCLEVIDLVKNHFIDKNYQIPDEKPEKIAETDALRDPLERYVFFKKLIGDYYRYLSEVTENEEANAEHRTKCGESYEAASEAAKKLGETHPTRLGLALNYSVAKYEILNQKEQACKLARDTFDSAIKSLDSLSDSTYKDSTLIMQLLRDNLTLWEKEQDMSNNPDIMQED